MNPTKPEEAITVVVLPHPAGCLVRIDHDGECITLNRDEALYLREVLDKELLEMPVKP